MNGQDRQHDAHDPALARTRGLFNRASARIDHAAANRLRLARREALAPSRPARRGAWIPAGAAMAAVLALGLSWWLPEKGAVGTDSVAQTASTAPEWDVDEDTDLYAWLGEAPVAIDATGKGAL